MANTCDFHTIWGMRDEYYEYYEHYIWALEICALWIIWYFEDMHEFELFWKVMKFTIFEYALWILLIMNFTIFGNALWILQIRGLVKRIAKQLIFWGHTIMNCSWEFGIYHDFIQFIDGILHSEPQSITYYVIRWPCAKIYLFFLSLCILCTRYIWSVLNFRLTHKETKQTLRVQKWPARICMTVCAMLHC